MKPNLTTGPRKLAPGTQTERATDARLFFWRPPNLKGLAPAEVRRIVGEQSRACARCARMARTLGWSRGAERWADRAQALRWVLRGLAAAVCLLACSGCRIGPHGLTFPWSPKLPAEAQGTQTNAVPAGNHR